MNENKHADVRISGRDPQVAGVVGCATRVHSRRPYAAPRIELLGSGLAGSLMSDVQAAAGTNLFGTSGTPLSSDVEGI